ncbi:hypothetical protein [Flavicella sp.]|uniref:hypothetical protein n=1 Tax=Flavicella sp. TaxID=2957742 RepID=UPI003016748A
MMNNEQKLSVLNKEVEYLEIEYLDKMSLNKQNSIAQAISIFKDIFKKNEYDFLLDNPLEIKVKKFNNICTIKPDFNYDKEPKKPRQFSIEIKKDKVLISKISTRLFMDEDSIDQPDFNRLLTNPYKGMDSTEIEIYERKKTVDYMKKFINESERLKWNYLSVNDSDKTQELHNNISQLYNKKVHNITYIKNS